MGHDHSDDYTHMNNEIRQTIEEAINAVDMDFQVSAYIELTQKIKSDVNATNRLSIVTRLAFEAYYDMAAARLNKDWKDRYFETLNTYLCESEDIKNELTLDVLMTAVGTDIDGAGRENIQPSFVSKLLHTVKRDEPIYDKHVRFFLKTGDVEGKTPEDRRRVAAEIYEKRIKNFYRDDRYGELRTLMLEVFNKMCENNENVSDVKKIDFVLCALGKLGKRITEFED